ncbi:homoserine kinase [Acaricomes phytoseiuli]|uniref:homoserine kinase n=1 Tax=Acaricomes phytoseiuli TaxID=291968 RepID=UPI000369C75E|nr:homoserine kinase [Acaricomes phytoseiuli]MCW1248713.1 homoserine kinase [Acaricomes phytoseiuli]
MPIALPLPIISPGQQVCVRVPATSANLGPGFDSLGLALSWYDTLTVEAAADDGLEIEIRGAGSDRLPRDASHLSVRCIDAFLARYQYRRGGLRLIAENSIPHGRGLGSSAAAIVAASLAAWQLLPEEARPGLDAVFAAAAALEGHPDNVAPALHGGLTISWHNWRGAQEEQEEQDGEHKDEQKSEQSRQYFVSGVPLNQGRLRAVVAVPEYELATERARSLLPETVAHSLAAANAARAGLLIHALTTDPSLLLPATRDYLHQDWRAVAMPQSAALLRHWREAGIAAVISGAGPTVLALVDGPERVREAIEVAERFLRSAEQRRDETASGQERAESLWRVREIGIEAEGARIISA